MPKKAKDGRKTVRQSGKDYDMAGKPNHRVSEAQKVADDFAHTKKVMDYYIDNASFLDENVTNSSNRDLYALYDAYNNNLPDSYFNYVTNPMNSSEKRFTQFPAKLRPYSIIRPNIDLLEGEYEKRPFNFLVKVNNEDAVNSIQEEQYNQVLKNLEQMFINNLNTKGVETGQETQEVELPDKVVNRILTSYKDERAMMGEAALSILTDDLYLESLYSRLFKDWLIAGEVFTYKGVEFDDVTYERVSPLDIDYDKSPDFEYIEDGQYVVRRKISTSSEVLDRFYEELDESDIDHIDTLEGAPGFSSYAGIEDLEKDLRVGKIELFHVCWKYRKKIGFLTFMDPITGEMEEIEVPDTYKPDKSTGETVEWVWVNVVWEGYRADTLYFGIREIPNQRNKMNNFSYCKLPYNGRRFSDVHSRNISPVELGIPYEVLYRILHYNLEKTIAKSKGKIALLDIHTVPNTDDMSEEQFFYYADATGFGLIDRSQPGVDKTYNQYQVLDMGLYQHINNLIQVMEFIKQEWDEVIGITRQRKGQVQASETASGIDAARYQSSVISERTFSKFEEFVQREMNGLLDCSKMAWKDGKKRLHYSDDMRTSILSIDSNKFMESEYDIHVSKSAKDIESLNMVKQQVQAFAQNGVSPSMIVDVVRSQSLSKLKYLLADAEQKSQEAAQAAAQGEQEAEERKLEIAQAYQEINNVFAKDLMHATKDREEDLEILKMTGQDQNPDSTVDPVANKKVDNDHANKNRELDLKNKEIESKERQNRDNNRTALKNKVSGEK